ncbi:MAG: hypothetical protein AB7F75_00540 [Planctomycetota bacterium]
MTTLAELLEAKIKAFLVKRQRPSDTPHLIRQALRALDTFFWKKADKIIEDRAPERGWQLTLNSEEKLLINMGVVTRELVGEPDEFFERLLFEMQGDVSGHTIFHVDEWLQHRWSIDSALQDAENAQTPVSSFRSNPAYQQSFEARARAFLQIRHLVATLPGVTPDLMKTLDDGRLARHLEDIHHTQVSGLAPLTEADRKLQIFHDTLFRRVRERCTTKSMQDAYKEWVTWDERVRHLVIEDSRDAKVENKMRVETKALESSSRFQMSRNLRLLKNLIPLGVTGTRLPLPFSPLFADTNRTTKPSLLRLWKGLLECDPTLPGEPDILIAPYAGSGFFEWDHNTLVVPVTTEHSMGAAFVQAVASYRIMTDSLNFDGRLKRAWAARFGKENFNRNFAENYHNWVLGVGLGRRLAMEREPFNFFMDHIAPKPSQGLGRQKILNLDNDNQLALLRDLRGRMNSHKASYQDILDMATIQWRRHNWMSALEFLEQAWKLEAHDPRLSFSYAYLSHKLNRQNARMLYEQVIEHHPKTLWRVYAEIQLEGDKL